MVNDWFLTGDASNLRWAFRLLIENQYVHSFSTPGLYKMILGSGMGYVHSANVMDSIFFYKSERNLIKQNCIQRWGIKQYLRYRDDLIIRIQAGKIELARRWLAGLRRQSGYFKLIADEVNTNRNGTTVSFEYLASIVFLSGGNGKVRIEAKVKATGEPLRSDSAHRSCIHRWPANMFRSIQSISPDGSSRRRAEKQLADWLQADPEMYKYWLLLARRSMPKKHSKATKLRCILPWHPSFSIADPLTGIRQALIRSNGLLRQAFGDECQVQFVWRNPAANNYMKLNLQ